MIVTKLDEFHISVETKVTDVKETVYTRGYLVKQRAAIEAQKARDNAARDAELAEVDALLVECDKLGIRLDPEGGLENGD